MASRVVNKIVEFGQEKGNMKLVNMDLKVQHSHVSLEMLTDPTFLQGLTLLKAQQLYCQVKEDIDQYTRVIDNWQGKKAEFKDTHTQYNVHMSYELHQDEVVVIVLKELIKRLSEKLAQTHI